MRSPLKAASAISKTQACWCFIATGRRISFDGNITFFGRMSSTGSCPFSAALPPLGSRLACGLWGPGPYLGSSVRTITGKADINCDITSTPPVVPDAGEHPEPGDKDACNNGDGPARFSQFISDAWIVGTGPSGRGSGFAPVVLSEGDISVNRDA